jgi:PAS domain S-box-containing protein
MCFGGFVLPWTRHVRAGRDLLHRGLLAANKMGDLVYAACGHHLTTNLLASGEPLVDVQREAENVLAFAQKARFAFIIDIAATQLGLIRTFRGLTPTFGSFDDGQFEELRIERRFTRSPDLQAECSYLIRKLQARFFAGEYRTAVEASSRAQSLLWTLASHFETAEYHFYGALSRAASCDSAPAAERKPHMEALAAHHKQLQVWAANCPDNFENRAALVAAEIARIEGRELDAERLYEQTIRSAHANGFIQNEALANELAARFYAARGFGKIARLYLQAARQGYVLWGADGKVQQLEQLHPYLRDVAVPGSRTATIGAPVERLDVGTVLKAAQAVSGEIILDELIKTLLRIAIEHAGAERGLLILFPGDEPRVAAEATTGRGQVEVTLRQTAASPAELPESVLHTVIRTRESVILDDASAQNPFSADEYLRQKLARSVLCLPLVKQAKLIGALYLENNLASHVFTPARIAVLELLASQAAISLENARLYGDLQEREARIRRLVDSNIIGVLIWDVQGRIIDANQAFLDMVGYGREDLVSGRLRWTELTPAEWRGPDEQIIAELKAVGTLQPREKEYLRKDGSRVPVLVARALFEWKPDEGVSFVIDMTDRKRAEESLRASEQRYRHLFEQMPIAMWQVDGRGIADLFAGRRAAGVTDLGTYLDQDPDFLLRLMDALIVEEVNEHAIKMFGAKDRNQLLGPSRFFWQRRPDTFRRAMESRFRGLPTFQEETKFVTLDGREIDVLFTDARLESIGERGTGLGGAIDITDRIRAQERLQQVQADFAHAARLSMLGEIAASIAHEVNQPLSAVRTNGETGLRWLDRPEPNIPKARELMQCILNDADRAADIIARIRAMATGRVPQQTALALHDVIAESMLFLRHELQFKGISVSLELAPAFPQVTGDRTQLNQVIVNLVINAVQAIVQSGTARRSISIRTMLSGAETVCCVVEDSGPGIDPTHRTRLFDSFFTTKDAGMGMGLSICRSIIEAHDGYIEADNKSALGGARFSFVLPANRASAG